MRSSWQPWSSRSSVIHPTPGHPPPHSLTHSRSFTWHLRSIRGVEMASATANPGRPHGAHRLVSQARNMVLAVFHYFRKQNLEEPIKETIKKTSEATQVSQAVVNKIRTQGKKSQDGVIYSPIHHPRSCAYTWNHWRIWQGHNKKRNPWLLWKRWATNPCPLRRKNKGPEPELPWRKNNPLEIIEEYGI